MKLMKKGGRIAGAATRGSRALLWIGSLAAVTLALSMTAFAGGGDEDGAPAPPSIGADVPVTYFGPMPSSVDKKLVGPVQLLRSGTLDHKAGSIELPLYRGKLRNGKSVWYILTDTTDKDNAEALGINHSAKLAYANVGRAVRKAWLQKDASLLFDRGAVDFSPKRALVPGAAPNAFPPASVTPGSVGDRFYTPLVRIENAGGHIYNAPVVAFDKTDAQIKFCAGNVNHDLVHDRVTKICPNGNGGGTVTVDTTLIFSFAKPSLYISMEASDPVPATLDNATFAPAMGDLPTGRDDSAFSAIERLFVIANGPMGRDNPQRQGLNSAITDMQDPLQVIGGIPTVALDYSPMWDLNLGEWTPTAIARGYRARVIDEFQYLGLVRQGHITGPGGKKFGSTGIVVNCPIVHRFL